MRPWAKAEAVEKLASSTKNPRSQRMLRLFVPQGLHWIEASGAGRWIESGEQAHHNGEPNGTAHQPPGNKPDLLRGEVLAAQVDVRPEVDNASDDPAQGDAERSAH